MTKKQKKVLYRIIITIIIYVPLFIMDHMGTVAFFEQGYLKFALFMIPYIFIGWDIIWKAVRNISHGQIFDENFLMTIATFGALGIGEYAEGVAVMLFYQIGELAQGYAVGRSRESIQQMMDICPEYANIEEDGQLKQVDPYDVAVDDEIIVKAGERVPLDGIVISGNSFVDTSALTGESVPREVTEGSEIISGCVNGSGLLRVKVTKEFDDSTVAKILELVENASSKKARVENFITRFAKYYTPTVVWAAAALAFLPPIILGGGFADWIQRACIFLVVSCPCALVISVPLSFFGGIGAASRQGILVKGSNYLEILSEMNTIVFDKTGTLTKGTFEVTEVITASGTEDEIIRMAALAEGYSDHPIAGALRAAYKNELLMSEVENIEEIPGHGIIATISGKKVYVGNEKLMAREGVDFKTYDRAGTLVYVAVEGTFLGVIEVSDIIKDEAKQAIEELKAHGVAKTVMLTGDRKEVGEAVAAQLKIDKVYTDLYPGDKVDKVEELINELGPKQ